MARPPKRNAGTTNVRRPMGAARVVFAVAATLGYMLLVSACGAGSPGGVHAVGVGDGRPEVVLREGVNHTIVHVPAGAEVELILGSEYWQVKGSSVPTLLRQDGPTHRLPRPRGCRAIPGLGCTPEMTKFRTHGHGTAVISAERSSCGEALRCSVKQENFTVTVVVD